MKIAVTGANGFIGRHVVAEIAKRSIRSVLVVRPSLEPPPTSSNSSVIPMDLRNPPANAFDMMGQPDVLIHLAWAGLPHYKSLHHFEEELPTQYRFLKMMVDNGLKNLVITGTCFEYGMQFGPLDEKLEMRPDNPYGFAKNTLRQQLQFLQRGTPFNLTWARLFYLYGEGQSENSLLPQLERAVKRGDKKFNMSGGEQLRDFLPVSEVARDLVSLALMEKDNGILNICSGHPISVRHLVEGWIKNNAWSIDLNLGYYPYPDYEPMAFWGDRSRLDQIINYAGKRK